MKEIAWLFDVDGVITNPSTKQVEHPEILDFIAERLAKGEYVALVTGRGLQWAMKRVAQPLENKLPDKKLLDTFFMSGEFGGASTTWQNGLPQHLVDSSISVPQEIIDEAKSLVERSYSDTNFYDTEKETMISIEMHDGMNIDTFKKAQAQLVPELQGLLLKHQLNDRFEVHVDRIATNIRAKGANKHHAAKQVVAWAESRNLKPDMYFAFGDSHSDTEIAEQIHMMHLPVELIFVGGKHHLEGKSFDFRITFTDEHCDDGVIEWVRENYKL